MENSSALFDRKLQKYDRLIRYASYRYALPGVLEHEDLYQEGLIILATFIKSDRFDPDSIDFEKMFKTELWHGLSHHLHKFKTAKRDFKKIIPHDYSDLERYACRRPSLQRSKMLGLGSYAQNKISIESFYCHADPQEAIELRESMARINGFVKLLVSRLDEEAIEILEEILDPTPWEDIPEYLKSTQHDDLYWREPKKKVPQHIIARMMDLPLIRVRRAIKRIKRAALDVGDELGFQLLAAAGINFERRD